MKYDLVRRFNSAWEKMSVKYEKESRKYPELYVTKPRVAFHGTRQGNVPNIGMVSFSNSIYPRRMDLTKPLFRERGMNPSSSFLLLSIIKSISKAIKSFSLNLDLLLPLVPGVSYM